jgi:hypothetical protein
MTIKCPNIPVVGRRHSLSDSGNDAPNLDEESSALFAQGKSRNKESPYMTKKVLDEWSMSRFERKNPHRKAESWLLVVGDKGY